MATSASTRIKRVCDVPMDGLLAGLPALCANGLLSGLDKHLSLPKGFYSALHILLTLAFMALGRIRRPEGLRHIAPGEFGDGGATQTAGGLFARETLAAHDAAVSFD